MKEFKSKPFVESLKRSFFLPEKIQSYINTGLKQYPIENMKDHARNALSKRQVAVIESEGSMKGEWIPAVLVDGDPTLYKLNKEGVLLGKNSVFVNYNEDESYSVIWIDSHGISQEFKMESNLVIKTVRPIKDGTELLENLQDLLGLTALRNIGINNKVAIAGSIDCSVLLPADVKNIVSVGGYINISGNHFEDRFCFSSLEDLDEYFYYTDIYAGDSKSVLKKMLPLIPDEELNDKSIALNNIEYTFYEGMDIMNSASGYRVDSHGNPEALQLFSPLFEGIRPDILWFQDLVQGIKKISPSYLVMLDKNNIPNNSLYIDHRKHMVYLNKIEAVIKIPKGAIQGNNNENYILINKPQAIGGVPKDILFMDLTKNFPKDMKKVLATIQDFLVGKLHVSDTHFRAISKHKLKEPYILEPSLYI